MFFLKKSSGYMQKTEAFSFVLEDEPMSSFDLFRVAEKIFRDDLLHNFRITLKNLNRSRKMSLLNHRFAFFLSV